LLQNNQQLTHGQLGIHKKSTTTYSHRLEIHAYTIRASKTQVIRYTWIITA